MLDVKEALALILQIVAERERRILEVALDDAYGFVLAEDVFSTLSLPPCDNSAVDGYAVHSGDVEDASVATPVSLTISAVSSAGGAKPGPVPPCCAVRILTGAPLPVGADCVVMQEDTQVGPGNTLLVFTKSEPGQHVRFAGTDLIPGVQIVQRGESIGAAEAAVLAATGTRNVRVYAPPRVAIVTTGDEIVDLDAPDLPDYGCIFDSNRYALTALLKQTGADICLVRHVPDDFEATCSILSDIAKLGVDLIVCAGGVSVGDRDFVRPAVERLGKLHLWRVAMKPGKPVAFGAIGDSYFFGLPGNPASVMVTFELFVRPAVLHLMGHARLMRTVVCAVLIDAIEHQPGRMEFVRARASWSNGRIEVTTTGAQGSGRLKSLLGSNALIIVPAERADVSIGETVEVMITGQMD